MENGTWKSDEPFTKVLAAAGVDADSYLLELTRSTHLNPVKPGIVKEPQDYPWIDHRASARQQRGQK